MGKVKDKIIHDAEKESERIINEAKKERDKNISNANEKKERILKESVIKKEKIIENEREKRKIFEEVEESKEIISKKNELLQSVFNNIKKKMLSWDETRYVDFIIKNLISSISNEKDELIIGKMHSKKLRKAIEKFSKSKGLKFTLLPEDGNFEFGFIVNRKKIQNRFTLDDIIEEIKEDKETKIVEELFG